LANEQLLIDELTRSEKPLKVRFKTNALALKQRAGIFLLLTLNFLLLILNIIDIKWVWFNFEWEGQYLKQFVHEGTYLLILSIIISIVIVLYFFRGNLNFYKKNKFLKIISFIWLGQNAILCVSVAIRNFWYIQYFALAYKRIGIILFLILTIYGLYSVTIKVQKQKSIFYLVKTNSFALLIVLTLSSLFNWDTYIAKYNFKHSNSAFLHLNYLSTLSDKALPYLNKSQKELTKIEGIQKGNFHFERNYMTADEYHKTINHRKNFFLQKWKQKDFFSWNYPEYLAAKKLKRNE
jgi:hypothetical protein